VPDNDATGVHSNVVVSNSGIGHVEVIEVEANVTHGNSGDLELVLSNGMTQSVLHPTHECLDPMTNSTQCSFIAPYVFTTVRHLDEPADGRWTLTVKDRKAGTTGTLASWKLRIYGRQ
jgi:subtilisin-like proprotein convertase family protein